MSNWTFLLNQDDFNRVKIERCKAEVYDTPSDHSFVVFFKIEDYPYKLTISENDFCFVDLVTNAIDDNPCDTSLYVIENYLTASHILLQESTVRVLPD